MAAHWKIRYEGTYLGFHFFTSTSLKNKPPSLFHGLDNKDCVGDSYILYSRLIGNLFCSFVHCSSLSNANTKISLKWSKVLNNQNESEFLFFIKALLNALSKKRILLTSFFAQQKRRERELNSARGIVVTIVWTDT